MPLKEAPRVLARVRGFSWQARDSFPYLMSCKIDSYIMTLTVDGRTGKMERGEMADSTPASAAQCSLVLKPNHLTDDPSRLQLLRKPSVTECPCPPWLVRAVFRVLRALSTRSLSLGKLRSPALFWHPLPPPATLFAIHGIRRYVLCRS